MTRTADKQHRPDSDKDQRICGWLRHDINAKRRAGPTLDVELRTLDSFAFKEVDFIKIDVEGHELSVIDGARQTIRVARPVMIVECEQRHLSGASVQDVFGRASKRLTARIK